MKMSLTDLRACYVRQIPKGYNIEFYKNGLKIGELEIVIYDTALSLLQYSHQNNLTIIFKELNKANRKEELSDMICKILGL